MKKTTLLILVLVFVLTSCREGSLQGVGNGTPGANANESRVTESSESPDEIWLATNIEKCLEKAVPPEPIEIESSFNPYYLRADLDAKSELEIVVLVRAVSDKFKRGVLICQNSRVPHLLGAISGSVKPFSDMDEDNFVTNEWEILSRAETRTFNCDTNGKPVGNDAKGESVMFVYEGGAFIIYWNGKSFVGVGGA
jgi:hypothetical protein